MKRYVKEMSRQELEDFFISIGEKKFRAKQVFRWIYAGCMHFDEMTDLPEKLRGALKENLEISGLKVRKCELSKTDGTRKYLFALSDGNAIESVFMMYKYGNAICISSQAGCRMGCTFCASGLPGLCRNLTAGEMLDQILCAQNDTGEAIGHVVVMGTGEPFDNYENLSRFLLMATSPEGLRLSRRNITVSTCGLVPQMERFAEDFPQINLAVSLHACTDDERSALMPVGKKYPLGILLSACKAYTQKTGRRITFEYALIRGVNDDEQHADKLAKLLSGMLCHVNLIPLSEVLETGLFSSGKERARAFCERLSGQGVSATVRRELGSDIHAACGQLRLQENQSI